MLIKVNDLDEDQISNVEQMLLHELAKPEVSCHLHHSFSVGSLLHDYGDQYTSPGYFTMTFVSMHNDVPIGVLQAIIIIENNFVKCAEVLAINCDTKKLFFGRDFREFYDFLYGFCHRIELSALVPHHSPIEGVKASKHLSRYNVQFLCRKSYVAKNLDGVWMDQIIWDIITPTGYDLINNS